MSVIAWIMRYIENKPERAGKSRSNSIKFTSKQRNQPKPMMGSFYAYLYYND